jgi:phosphatidylserine/phosphatidylglycerophosphate/cardiolipin synthase-like enzyme
LPRFHMFRSTPVRALVALLILAGLFAVFQWFPRENPPAPVEEVATDDTWYSLYFSDPSSPSAESLRGGPDAYLAEALDAARYSIDIAVYRLDLWSIRDALKRAHRRGVSVRVITESNHENEPEIESLRTAGIPVQSDQREHLMHHKFVVIDRLEVWTGSMNFTMNGAYRNDNNLLRIRSHRVAEDYTREFEEMFIEDRYGALSLTDTPYPVVSIDGTNVEVYFSPDDPVADHLIRMIKEADRSIDFLAYTLTHDAITDALLVRAAQGVSVRGVVEAGQASAAGGDTTRLREAGLDVRLDTSPGRMHHKVMIIDRETVVTGSFNFTRTAEQDNDENTLIVHDVDLTHQFLIEFEQIFEMASP